MKEMINELKEVMEKREKLMALEDKISSEDFDASMSFYDQWVNDVMTDLVKTDKVAILFDGWLEDSETDYASSTWYATYKDKNDVLVVVNYLKSGNIRATLNYRLPDETSIVASSEDEAIKKLLGVDEVVYC